MKELRKVKDMSNILLVNATPAKFGGAKSIIEKFIETADFSSYKSVYLLAPHGTNIKNEKVKLIELESNGLFSLLFTIFLIRFYVYKLKASHLISFNNVNLLFSKVRTVTYYHTPHIFYSSSLRHKLLRLIIKYGMRGERFVFQSDYVQSEFINMFGSCYKTHVNWCGFDLPHQTTNKSIHKKIRCLVPVVDCYSKVKNFNLVCQNIELFQKLGIEIIALDSVGDYPGKIKYIGRKSKKDLFDVYNNCDMLLMPSLFETVGLPIFEFAATGKPVLVLDKPYLDGIEKTVGLTSNIIKFTEDTLEKKLKYTLNNYNNICIKRLTENHPSVRSNWSDLMKVR
ncbi:glycosyltransferase [Pseudoalteromonas sp. S983]|uniref:glycosyltransferase n=1 Tax=Pseudoalteromonas sp. S983 TaxID=579572 RepID=UPI00110B55FC|nr:glycosyltransferase [Pseudoalteromonas sp. S983]TMP79136.1 hypothetical protein CWB71_16425 [Pseudoalteromonas sp. S983]